MVKYFHTGVSGQKGGTTVAYETVSKGEDGSLRLMVAMSRCSTSPESTDVFDKKKGRLISAGRLRTPGKHMEVVVGPEESKYDVFQRLCKAADIATEASYGKQLHLPGSRKNAGKA